MAHDINRWIFTIPLEDVQIQNFEEVGKFPCLLCGKSIKTPKNALHLLNSGLVSSDQQFDDSEDLGFFPVGNECKGKIPNNFVFEWTF